MIGYGVAMRRPGVSTLLLVLAVLVLAVPSPASALRLDRVAGGFDSPVHATASPRGSALYVVEQEGQIWRLGSGGRSLFLDIRGLVGYGGERGLFSVAFPSNYAQIPVSLRQLHGQRRRRSRGALPRQHVLQPRRGTGRARCSSTSSTPRAGTTTAGRWPSAPNGRLYVSVGDGGGGCDPGGNAQDLSSRKGKLLSIDTGRAVRGLAHRRLRAPQPLAFLLRPLDGTAVRRRRWPEQLGGDQHPARLAAWAGRPRTTCGIATRDVQSSGCSTGGLRGPGDQHPSQGTSTATRWAARSPAGTSTGAASSPRACAAGTSSATTAPAASGG